MSSLARVLRDAARARADVSALLDALDSQRVCVDADGTVEPTRLLAALLAGGALIAMKRGVEQWDWVAAAQQAFSTMKSIERAEQAKGTGEKQ